MDLIFSLISKTYITDAIGQKIAQETKRTVYGTKYPITRAEWNTGGQNGLKPEFMIAMFTYDYQGEELAEVEGARYGIYRTYTNNDRVELYMERKTGI